MGYEGSNLAFCSSQKVWDMEVYGLRVVLVVDQQIRLDYKYHDIDNINKPLTVVVFQVRSLLER